MRCSIGAMLLVATACGRGNFGERVDAARDDSATGDIDAVAIGDTAVEPWVLLGDLSDDFNDGAMSTFWDSYAGTAVGESTYAEAGGALVITPGDTVADIYAGYVTAVGYDMRGRSSVVHVLETSTVVGANCYATFVGSTGNFGIVASNSVLQAMENDVAFVQQPFDLAQQGWWRVREETGTITFATSPDGRTWTVFATRASPSYVNSVKPNLGGGNYQVVTSPGQCRFDDFGRPPP